MIMREPIIGIDLGTTNSEVAIVQNGMVTVIDANGNKILPSAVGLSHDGLLLVGESAKNQYALYPERTVVSIKRRMGSLDKVKLGDTAYLPQEISAMILKHLKAMAEDYLKCSVSKAVITVPAYFSEAQRQATKEAGEIAGLEVVRMINEPTAAALAYEAQNSKQKKVLIYDLGGGTFDVSIVSLQSQVVEVLASTGNNHLGGDDFDAKIVNFIENYLIEQGIDISQSTQARARIIRAAEKAKITLSDHPFALIEEEYLLEHQGKPYHLSLELSRDSYQKMIQPHINETLEAVHKALDSAGLMASDIEKILLVGGSTRTPIIADKLSEIFHDRPHAEIDPELCVATGAAIQASIIAGEKCNSVLVDVTPYTYGTSYLGFLSDGMLYTDVYKPIIQKNTPIPVTKSEVFFTSHDHQEVVEVSVYQGEKEDALENIEIGKFKVEGLSKVPAGNPIIINFKLDLDGMLHVTTKEKRSCLEKKLVINNVISQFTQHEISSAKERIDQLFQEPDLRDENYDGSDEDNVMTIIPKMKTHANQLIEKAELLLDRVSSEDKEDLINVIEEVKDAIANNNENNILINTEKLSDMLFYLDAEVV
jgi:molecular chaperone DnaK